MTAPYNPPDNIIGDLVDMTFIRLDTTWVDPHAISAVMPKGQGCNIILDCGLAVPLDIDADEVMEMLKHVIAARQNGFV